MPVNGQTNQQIPIQALGNGSAFPMQQSIAGQAGYPASSPLKGAVIPYWSYGAGVPTFVAPVGSLYTRTDVVAPGIAVLYIYKPATSGSSIINTWQVIA